MVSYSCSKKHSNEVSNQTATKLTQEKKTKSSVLSVERKVNIVTSVSSSLDSISVIAVILRLKIAHDFKNTKRTSNAKSNKKK